MIKSRRLTKDPAISCARCVHLCYSWACYGCDIDGTMAPDPGVITMTTCHKWKEVKENGSEGRIQPGSEAG